MVAERTTQERVTDYLKGKLPEEAQRDHAEQERDHSAGRSRGDGKQQGEQHLLAQRPVGIGKGGQEDKPARLQVSHRRRQVVEDRIAFVIRAERAQKKRNKQDSDPHAQ